MNSVVDFELRKRIINADQAEKFTISFVIPSPYKSPAFGQLPKDYEFKPSVAPSERIERTDERGNRILEVVWLNPPSVLDVRILFKLFSKTELLRVQTDAPFPVASAPTDVATYLHASEEVQSNDPRIREKAAMLTANAKTQFEAVKNVITWLIDHMRYVLNPPRYDALYAFDAQRGNCQNYSHLAAALLRASGIPARIVNGITLDTPYDVQLKDTLLRQKTALGRHAWIEIWFPDLGWTPFDPQNTALFVSNRFVRFEVGIDNKESQNDGLSRWVQKTFAFSRPRIEEYYAPVMRADRVAISGTKLDSGPDGTLFSPEVTTGSGVALLTATPGMVAISPSPKPAPPAKPVFPSVSPGNTKPPVSGSKPPVLPPKGGRIYNRPFISGNLEFPHDVDFTQYKDLISLGKNTFESRPGFLVETAEYATTKMIQYAQVFRVDKPSLINSVGLALHRFGGGGQIWVELMSDADGKPGERIAETEIMEAESISMHPGYRWIDFRFAKPQVLKPGNYWLGLGFTGDSVINWFYTYGKPVGPAFGTRFKDALLPDWSGAMNYEFNYRVIGFSAS